MITEDYVSFDVAKLLKEKGFDENCDRAYVKDKLARSQGFNNSYYEMIYPDATYRPVSAPTLQMAIKWLRKKHKLFIFIVPWLMLENSIQYYFEIREIKTRDFDTLYSHTSKELNSFEKVAESAIKYCLENLI